MAFLSCEKKVLANFVYFFRAFITNRYSYSIMNIWQSKDDLKMSVVHSDNLIAAILFWQ